jgi:hypothetical protein
MNYIRPGRFHLIKRPGFIYVTLWFWGKRFHYCNSPMTWNNPWVPETPHVKATP